MIREQDGGLFTNSLEDWGKLWVDSHPYLGIDPHRVETTTIDWIAPPMTATEIQRQVKDAMREFDKQKEIETIAGFKIGDRVESLDAYRFGTVTDLTYERKIDDEIYIMNVVWDDGMTSEFFLPTNEIIKVKKGEEKMIKVGDIVTVKCGKDTKNKYHIRPSMETMERENKGYEVTDIRDGGILVEVKGSDTRLWNFHINDVKLFNKGEEKMKKEKTKSNERFEFNHKYYRVMFNGPATILFVDGLYTASEKYITKAYNENFDEEKGLALALLKSFGISYLDFKRILATAKKEEKKVEENKNQVKVKKETIKKETAIVSPKGRKKGKPFTFFVGDQVVVRDCERYSYTTNSNAKKCLNKVLTIKADESDFTGTCYVVDGYEFSGSELQPYQE